MTGDVIGDELHKLAEEFRKLAGLPTSISEKTTPEQLTKFGLTLDEAKAWLKQEPNFFVSRRKVTDFKNDGEVTEPVEPIYRGGISQKSHKRPNHNRPTTTKMRKTTKYLENLIYQRFHSTFECHG